ncbi:hypothetical protein JQ604_41260 [Bradyrhizobium jicamae]|uniref:hypothetical protein n=1 Tax=Bradyrhizobium jicamae TaxID=280332 RepID=UPI001BA4C399|nr:hypothetical protein [Bradyrhizobium jicamae]MBR0758649.1 hypothetical protein [Bradyrhizobium jicamae]
MRFVLVFTMFFFAGLSSTKAQNLHSWVSPQGSDGNACTAASPCLTFSGALQKTNAGGEIGCSTSGYYGPVYITKSITIDCSAVHAEISQNSFPGGIQVAIAASDTVVLRGLDLDCAYLSGQGSIPCIALDSSGTLIVDHVKVSGSIGSSPLYSGLWVSNNSAGLAKVVVTDSIFVHNGGSTTGAGILIRPISAGGVQVSIDRVTVAGNTFGIAFDTSQTQAGINATVSNSTVSSNTNDAIVAANGNGPIGVTIRNSQLINNGFGTRSIGTGATVRVENTAIIGNSVGISALSGGTLLTAGNNLVQANGTNGTFTGGVPLN